MAEQSGCQHTEPWEAASMELRVCSPVRTVALMQRKIMGWLLVISESGRISIYLEKKHKSPSWSGPHRSNITREVENGAHGAT